MKLTLSDAHDNYLKRHYAQPEVARHIWRQSLTYSLTENHVPFDCTPQQFIQLQRKAYCELLRRIAMIPSKGSRGAGKAQVMLTCHLAKVCCIPEQVAHRIVCSCYEHQFQDVPTKNPPIQDPTSFRVVKMRMTPAE